MWSLGVVDCASSWKRALRPWSVPNLVLHRWWDMGLLLGWSQMRAGLLGMFCLVNGRNLVFLRLVEQVRQLLCRLDRSETRQTRLSHLECRMEQGHASLLLPVFSAEDTVPSTYPLKNTTNTHGSSGESCMEQLQIHILRNASPFFLHSLHLLSPLESSWCHGIRRSTERNGTVRRAKETEP